ncbi:hypothetical protein VM1G_11460 [Cytospora mali]|uniref:Uncharacterized protein n=1 Tax=Cytospora mali TaxID=578113 RepID=A0A194VV20_CYTMA|nr:hypothetical protein VM1G_11460 [Valsa mali]
MARAHNAARTRPMMKTLLCVGLPSGGDAGQQNGVVHGRHEGERGGGDGRPEHPAADDGPGHGDLDALPDFVGAVAGEEALQGEVVSAEDRGVDDLVDADLRGECQELAGVVEVTGDEEEPGRKRAICQPFVRPRGFAEQGGGGARWGARAYHLKMMIEDPALIAKTLRKAGCTGAAGVGAVAAELMAFCDSCRRRAVVLKLDLKEKLAERLAGFKKSCCEGGVDMCRRWARKRLDANLP